MEKTRPMVALVDDDPRLLQSLEELLESAASCGLLLRFGEGFARPRAVALGPAHYRHRHAWHERLELRDQVKKVRRELPVFLITSRHKIADQGRAQGASGFFRKPFDAPALLIAISEACKNRDGG
jgi:FixJ family two-component response regulator